MVKSNWQQAVKYQSRDLRGTELSAAPASGSGRTERLSVISQWHSRHSSLVMHLKVPTPPGIPTAAAVFWLHFLPVSSPNFQHNQRN